jgi:hypothetical protein
MTKYIDIQEHVQPFESPSFKVEHIHIDQKMVEEVKFRSALRGQVKEVRTLKAGRYIKLTDKRKKEIVMSDTPMELETNNEVLENARGSVLIGGLGLGIILLAIQKKKEVKRIVVVEKEMELIIRIASQLPLNNKVEIVHGDILTWETDEKFDTQYFDIWNHISGDNWAEMKALNARYRKNRNKGAWVRSWRQDDCQRLERETRRLEFNIPTYD